MRAEPEHALPKHPATLTWADLTNAQREHLARTDRPTFDRLLAAHRAR
ncbi:MAG: hypothetical protein O3A02_03245 [bacterium]|nr:hypothetical protein [bacterium]